MYLTLKSIHIFGVILLMGNIIVTAWWKGRANRSRNPIIIGFAQRQVTATDWLFTLPGAILIVASGDWVGYKLIADSWSLTWLTWGRLLFIASGVLWLAVLVPVQIKQAHLARGFEQGGAIPEVYWHLNQIWYRVGIVAVLLPLANLYWMVFKPS